MQTIDTGPLHCNGERRRSKAKAKARSRSAGAISEDRPPRILVIDDSPTVILALRQAFAELASEIDTVDHYLEIPRYLRETPPDLVILDLSIPFLSGERISTFIRREQQRDTPILVYSSLPVGTLRIIAARIDAAGWASKQGPMDELVAMAEDTLARRRSRDER